MAFSSNKSQSYLVRNPSSYCFRLVVPPDLRGTVGRRELRYSLRTGSIAVAKIRARYMAGRIQVLFLYLRNGNITGGVSQNWIQNQFRQYLDQALNASDGAFGDGSELMLSGSIFGAWIFL